MDLGTYERMLDQDLAGPNFVTAGQIFTTILERERRGGYLGRDVQMIPHVTGEVKGRLRTLAMTGGPGGGPADVVFVEVGGTVGDYENGFYIEALRELAFEEGQGSTCFVALTYVLEPQILGEQKSKAAQLGIKLLMQAGIQPHIVACRAHQEVSDTVLQKISMFSNVPLRRVFSMHDRASIYTIPEAMRAQGLDRQVLSLLGLHDRVDPLHEDRARARLRSYASKIVATRRWPLTLGIVGKYAALRDAYASIDKAIEHASTHLSADVDVKWIDTSDITRENVEERLGGQDLDAMIVPGGFGDRGVEGKIACAEFARTRGVPFLGICLGFQVAVIEVARNVLGMSGAVSTEFEPPGPLASGRDAVISELPEQKKIEGLGGTMRLGAQDVAIEAGSLASWLYDGRTTIRERFRHRFEVDPAYIDRLKEGGLTFTGRHPGHPIMQVLELPADAHPFFIATQYHPELTSRPLAPQPMFMGLIAAGIARAHPDAKPDAISTRWLRGAPANPDKAAPAADAPAPGAADATRGETAALHR